MILPSFSKIFFYISWPKELFLRAHADGTWMVGALCFSTERCLHAISVARLSSKLWLDERLWFLLLLLFNLFSKGEYSPDSWERMKLFWALYRSAFESFAGQSSEIAFTTDKKATRDCALGTGNHPLLTACWVASMMSGCQTLAAQCGPWAALYLKLPLALLWKHESDWAEKQHRALLMLWEVLCPVAPVISII